MLRLISQSANDPLHHLTVGNELVRCRFADAWQEKAQNSGDQFRQEDACNHMDDHHSLE
jgi:hypothetical protein